MYIPTLLLSSIFAILTTHYTTAMEDARKNNPDILTHPSLKLDQESLDNFLVYYGALGRTDIVKNLLDKGANPNACDDNGLGTIHYAMQYGYKEITDMISEHPAFSNTDFINNLNGAHLPAIQNNENNLMTDMCAKCTYDNEAMLCFAAKHGLFTLVKELLNSGTRPNIVDAHNISPLCHATAHGHINIMKLLLDHHASPDYLTNTTPALHLAAEHGYTSAVQLLADHKPANYIGTECFKTIAHIHSGEKETVLHCAVKKNRIKIIKILLSNGVYPNYPAVISNERPRGEMPLHIASFAGKTEIIKLLLDHKANVDAKDSRGTTPLYEAILAGHVEAVEILVKAKADLNVINDKNHTPLDLINKLINANKQPNGNPENIKKYIAMGEMLVKHGAKTKDGLTSTDENCTIQ